MPDLLTIEGAPFDANTYATDYVGDLVMINGVWYRITSIRLDGTTTYRKATAEEQATGPSWK